jgi:type VI secretion system protein ImpF
MLRSGNRLGPPVAQSVLDRLINLDPKSESEVPLTAAKSMEKFKRGLRRDLEWLLNTRSIAVPPPDSFRELNRSVYVYGFPDLSSFSMANPKDKDRLQRAIQAIVRLFERRIGDARVVLVDPTERAHTLHFRIEGMLRTDPVEPVSFDTVLRLTSGKYEVNGDADA